MAERWAITPGNIDDANNWNNSGVLGDLDVPTSADDVYLNNKAMTSSGSSDITWLSLRNSAGTTALAGGSLTISAARNFVITDMHLRLDAATANGLIVITAASGTVSITGTARSGPSGGTTYCIYRSGNCHFIFNGGILFPGGVSGMGAVINLQGGTGTFEIGSAATPITIPAAFVNGISINGASISGNIYADQFMGGTNGSAVSITSGGNINTFGPVYGGPASGRHGIAATSATGAHVHTGDCYAGTAGSTPYGISKSGASSLVVNGKLISNTTYNTSYAVSVLAGNFTLNSDTPRDIELGPSAPLIVSGATTNYTLNVRHVTRVTQANVNAIVATSGSIGTTNFTGTLQSGTGGSLAVIVNIGTGTHTVNSTNPITGGAAANIPGITLGNAGATVTINADVTGGEFSGAHGVSVGVASCTVTINGKAKGNTYGVGGAAAGPAVGVSVVALSTVSVREVESGLNGQSPTIGPVLMMPSALNKSTHRQTAGGATTELVPAAIGGSSQSSSGYVL